MVLVHAPSSSLFPYTTLFRSSARRCFAYIDTRDPRALALSFALPLAAGRKRQCERQRQCARIACIDVSEAAARRRSEERRVGKERRARCVHEHHERQKRSSEQVHTELHNT